MTLHVLLHRDKVALAVATMRPDDILILGADALNLVGQSFPTSRVYVLAEDCRQWGITPPTWVLPLTDEEWVEATATAVRVVHW
ncbi:MAG: hypothetical protein WED11_07925 [Natronospirillum sp.]